MRLVQFDDGGVIQLRWMWLPTFIGQNAGLLQQLRNALNKEFIHKEVNETLLDEIHEYVISWFVDKVRIRGFREYLEGISSVKED